MTERLERIMKVAQLWFEIGGDPLSKFGTLIGVELVLALDEADKVHGGKGCLTAIEPQIKQWGFRG